MACSPGELFHQEAVLVVAQQVAADGRRVQVRGVEVDEGLVGGLCGGLVDAFGLGALEGFVDLPASQVQTPDRATAGQLGPVGRLVDVWRTLAIFGRALPPSIRPSETATSWAARMTISLTTITVTVAPVTASMVTALLSLERPTTTRWSARMPGTWR